MGWLWGRKKKADEDSHSLRLTVRFEGEEGGEFQIPACGHGRIGEYWPFDWMINWGDGSSERATGSSSPKGGEVRAGSLVHPYREHGEYVVTITPAGSISETAGDEPGWLQAFGYPESWAFSVDENRRFVEYVFPKGGEHLVCVDGVLDDYAINIELEGACAEMFIGCENITMGPDFTFSSRKRKAGNFFCNQMFAQCKGDSFTMGSSFQLPQELHEVGEAFCQKMFHFCLGKSFTMNDDFTLPQKITTAGSGFCNQMFYEHGPNFSMGRSFNLPQEMIEADDYFCSYMFAGEARSPSTFSMNEVFNLPPNISGHVGDSFCKSMFCGNSGDAFRMNSLFNLPQNISSAGDSFCSFMFAWCSGRRFSMNDVFTIPRPLNYAGDDFCRSMFGGCDGIDFIVGPNFAFSNGRFGSRAFMDMFSGCRVSSLSSEAVTKSAAMFPELQIWSPKFFF